MASTVVIIGGSSGFGLALARALAAQGARVLITGRSDQTVREAAASVDSARVQSAVCDIRDRQQLELLWSDATDRFGRVDHWIVNAALGGRSTPFVELDAARVEETISTNLKGAMLAAQVAVVGMKSHRGGTIWLTEGLGSDGMVLDGAALYGATKAGASYAYKVLAKECVRTSIKIGFIRPGIMPTKLALGDHAQPDPRASWIIDILGDEPETVADWMAPRLLAARRNGVRLNWLNPLRLAFRALKGLPKLMKGPPR